MVFGALFPGQGSQHVGMGRFIWDNFKSTKLLFEEASDTLKQDFKKLCFDGPESDLALTANTQPALVLVSAATFEVLWMETEIKFSYGAGHSVGEYSALVAAKALKLSDALLAVRERGLAMQEAVPVGKGGMVAALGLTDDQVKDLCRWAMKTSNLSPIEAANFNAPGQIVLSGDQQLIDWLIENFDSAAIGNPKRCKFIPLKVSAPFHCQLMMPAQEKMETVLGEIPMQPPDFGIVQNVNGQESQDPKVLKNRLIEQISQPVLWMDCIHRLQKLGVEQFIEVGPGQVLSGLVKKIDREIRPTLNINSVEKIKELEKLIKEMN